MQPLHQHPDTPSRLLWPLLFGRTARCPHCGLPIEVAGRWRYPIQTAVLLALLLSLGLAARLRLGPVFALLAAVVLAATAQLLLAWCAPRVVVTPAMRASRRYAAWGLLAFVLLMLLVGALYR